MFLGELRIFVKLVSPQSLFQEESLLGKAEEDFCHPLVHDSYLLKLTLFFPSHQELKKKKKKHRAQTRLMEVPNSAHLLQYWRCVCIISFCN